MRLEREKELRLLEVARRDKRMRDSAKRVVLHGDPMPPKIEEGVYVETLTGKALRERFAFDLGE